eukprot:IDg13111t1
MTFVAIAALAAVIAVVSSSSCMSSVEKTYKLRSTGLDWINPHLKGDKLYRALVKRGCSDSRRSFDVCHKKPAIGSGLEQLSNNYFLGLTNRGPNQNAQSLQNTLSVTQTLSARREQDSRCPASHRPSYISKQAALAGS